MPITILELPFYSVLTVEGANYVVGDMAKYLEIVILVVPQTQIYVVWMRIYLI